MLLRYTSKYKPIRVVPKQVQERPIHFLRFIFSKLTVVWPITDQTFHGIREKFVTVLDRHLRHYIDIRARSAPQLVSQRVAIVGGHPHPARFCRLDQADLLSSHFFQEHRLIAGRRGQADQKNRRRYIHMSVFTSLYPRPATCARAPGTSATFCRRHLDRSTSALT